MIGRMLTPLNNKSFFLFGARGVGKSTYLENVYSQNQAVFVDLLNPEVLDEYIFEISRFTQLISSEENRNKIIIVDEIQKLPALLDIIQSRIQKDKRIFILTGSSARKLKQSGSNLLAGRALVYALFPFSTFELKDDFQLEKVLNFGSLPDAYFAETEEHTKGYLDAYVVTYLEKEIQQEQWVRKIEPFRRFLRVAAQMNGKIINYSAIARDVGADDSSIKQYFEILEDTLLGFILPAHHKSVRKSQRIAPKFYFFDTGVKKAIEKSLNFPLAPYSSPYGDAFEHWIFLELTRLISYFRKDWTLSYSRSKHGVEIDFIIERPYESTIQVEVKSKKKVSATDAQGLETLGCDLDPRANRYLLSQDPLVQTFGSTQALPWKTGLQKIFQF
ncbi:MAG: ATP-binding protein [Deltaproteobacteria bacterium]|nr:ATP-binding protein [Deltaproteobacteria bacterium]